MKAATRSVVAAFVVAVFSSCGGATEAPSPGRSAAMPQADSIPTPPAQQTFTAPGGRYAFVLSMLGGDPVQWARTGSDGALFVVSGGSRRELWRRHLPHEYRPRTALVANDGVVLLFDQWINVAGPHALTVIDATGRTVASYSFDDIASALGVPRASLAAVSGMFGPWRAGEPTLNTSGNMAQVAAGGKTLMIRLSDGALSALP